ncbi:MAG: NAD-dependent dihydropyrimidine dehydrogenase subunit PreA [Anaerolineae bacterium]
MADLSVEFAGLKLSNPFMLASAPPTNNGEMIQRAFEAGWGGAITKTLALEPARDVQPRLGHTADGKRLIGFENIELITQRELDVWCKDIAEIKKNYPDHVLLASLMAAVQQDDWHELVAQVEEAGVDGLEINLGCPHGMPEKGMGAIQGQDPEIAGRVTKWVKEVAKTPVMVKLTPNVTDLPLIARAVEAAGADAISAINTVLCLIGVDLDTFEPLPSVAGYSSFGGYSGPAVKPIGLRCVAQLAQSTRVPISGIGGISRWQDAAEYILVGASTVQLCTAVMFRGYRIIDRLTKGLSRYMDEKGLASVSEMVGKTLPRLVAHEALDFDYKVVAAIDEALCTGCRLCVTACYDGGWQAIEMTETEEVPRVLLDKCDGCSLCLHVCPVDGAISMMVRAS